MTDQAISPLRRRMIEDMSIRKFTSGTQHNYVRFVKEFSIFFGRSPDKAAFEDVRRYQLHLASRGVSPFTINAAVTALRFFFKVTLRRHDIADHIPFVSQPQNLPVILSPMRWRGCSRPPEAPNTRRHWASRMALACARPRSECSRSRTSIASA